MRSIPTWAALLVFGFTLGLLFLSAQRRWPFFVVLITAAGLMLAAVVLRLKLRQLRADKRSGLLRVLLPLAMLVLGGWLISRYFSDATDGWGFLGVSLCYFAAGQVLTEFRSTKRWAPARGILIIALSAAMFAVGLTAVSPGLPTWALILLAAGVLLSPVGLSLLSEDLIRQFRSSSSRLGRILLMAGIVAIAAGLSGLVMMGVPVWPYVTLAALALFLLVGAITSNTDADVITVVAVVAIAWALAPRGVSPTPSVVLEDGETALVALGDSYMSGEGAETFFEGTNTKKKNECRRAPTAFAPLVVSGEDDAIPDNVAFLACSGAKAIEIHHEAQHEGEPIRPDGAEGPGLHQLEHWAWLLASADVEAELVIVTIGGNDALFGDIGRTCVLPGDCSEVGAEWLENLETEVADEVEEAYEQIRATFDDIPALVVPYPIPLNESGCHSSALTADEHRFLHGFVHELDEILRREADDAGLYYLEEMELSLKDRNLRICDDNPDVVGVNFLASNPTDGPVEERVNPLNWFHNSLHPNDRGHRVMRDTLASWIEQHPNAPPAEPSGSTGHHVVSSIEEIMGSGFEHCGEPTPKLNYCEGDAGDWVLAQVVHFVWLSLIPLFLLVTGVWLIWVQIIRWYRGRSAVSGPL